ncbi:MAG TPA: hypothetical protein VE224_19050 [Pseudolabrys sp.]|nr:hypothetical protein [Pseudolabrys sp.]
MSETAHERALRHVTCGRRIIAAQQKRIEQLRAQGKDTSRAQALLEQFERSQAIFEDDLWRLERLQGHRSI